VLNSFVSHTSINYRMMLPGARHGDGAFDQPANLEVVTAFFRAHLRGAAAH
jgi:hypothetical protein